MKRSPAGAPICGGFDDLVVIESETSHSLGQDDIWRGIGKGGSSMKYNLCPLVTVRRPCGRFAPLMRLESMTLRTTIACIAHRSGVAFMSDSDILIAQPKAKAISVAPGSKEQIRMVDA